MKVIRRSDQKEIMDDMRINDERIDNALKELSVVNKWLGGDSTSLKGLQILLKGIPPGRKISVLDVGAGGSDFAVAVSSMKREIEITAVDLNSRACEYLKSRHPSISVVRATVLDLPFEAASFDIIHVSLFLHHFTESELKKILLSLFAISRYGIIINDLRRSLFSYTGILLLTRLFSGSAMVKHDGPLSVLRGFSSSELAGLCSGIPSARYIIMRSWAFRWLVCITKPL